MADVLQRVSDFSVNEIYTDAYRFFNLSGRALPHRPISFGTSVKTSTQFYSGNPESQIQITSSESDKTNIKGRWSGRHIDGNSGEIHFGSAVSFNEIKTNTTMFAEFGKDIVDKKLSSEIASDEESAMLDFCEWLEEFVATGPTILCTFSNRTRKGILKHFKYDIKDSRDIDWEMEFEWNSYKADIGRSAFTDTKANDITKDWINTLKDYRVMLEQALGLDPLSGMYGPNIPIVSDVFDVIRDINNAMLSINSAITEVEKMNEALVAGVFKPSQLARNAIAVMTNAFASIERMEDIWKQTAIQEMTAWQYQADSIGKPGWQDSLPNTAGSIYFDSKSFSDYGIASQYKTPVTGGSSYQSLGKPVVNYSLLAESLKPGLNNSSLPFDMRAILRVLKYKMQTSISQISKYDETRAELKSVEIANENQHIGTIANKHYGAWNKWPQLAEYNKLSSPLLPAGKMVLVPWNLQD